MSLKDKVIIQNYSLSEELINAISHGIGVFLGIAALVLCIVLSSIHANPWAVVSSSIYGATLIILYLMSTLYHSLKVNNAKRVFQIFDHCSIYLLIAGTYTPYTLVSLNGAIGWTLFGIVWGLAILGIVLNSIDIKKYRKISAISYILLGWIIIFAFRPISQAIQAEGLWLLILGGIAYTVGAIFYGFGKKLRYMHSVFHIFVLIGSIFHFFSIFLYVI